MLGSLVVLAGGGITLAEGPAPDAGPQDDGHEAAGEGSDELPDLSAPLRARAEITVQEMNEGTADAFEKLDDLLERMSELQEIARREKDVIKLNCVNDKIEQLKQLVKIADQARTNLGEAIARGDEEARYHEFGRVTIALQQAQELASEAENCVGEDLTFIGPTQIIVDEPVLPDDPTAVVGPDFPVVEPLPVASPQA